MGIFKDIVNVQPHDFNTSTLKINNIIVDGLDSFSANKEVDKVTAQTVADGLGLLVVDPSRVVMFTFSALEAVASSNDLWTLEQAGTVFSLSFKDSNATEFNCSGQCLFTTSPTVERQKEASVVEWTCITVFGTMRGGSYTLQSS